MDEAITEDAELDDVIKKGADDYDKSQKEGQEYIRKAWSVLKKETKAFLMTSGWYDQHGKQIEVEDRFPDDAVNNLEHSLATLKRCAEYSLPLRTTKDWFIKGEALSDDVLVACDELLYMNQFHEPIFFRLALRAVRIHRLANLMTRLPAINEKFLLVEPIFKIIVAILAGLLALASPYFLGVALTAAAKGDQDSAVFSLYAIGLAILFVGWVNNLAKDESISGDELEYKEWYMNPFVVGSWLSTGAGAKFYFQEMAKKGVNVPPLAIDLCAALEASVLTKGSEHV